MSPVLPEVALFHGTLRALAVALFAFPMTSCSLGPDRGGADGTSFEREEKSVFIGELLAIFPGLFVHGLGHRYAGNTERANELLMMELYSGATAGLGGGLYALGRSEDADALEIAGWVGIGVGGIAFQGTWIYDIVYTPSEVNRYNARIAAGK